MEHDHARLDYSKLGLRLAGDEVEASFMKVDNVRPNAGRRFKARSARQEIATPIGSPIGRSGRGRPANG
ncbi:hypothetical protein CU048_14400 [Beijerinckiaceae bacterium]|nr:hypothetical protein CU048_14400 [Beijerinckiaceae bacterium]